MIFFYIFRHSFHRKKRLSRKNELGHEQERSMLFPKHPYFLLIGIKTNEWRLACQNEEIEEFFFKRCFSACQLPFMPNNAYQ
jgi:hypothetical protein